MKQNRRRSIFLALSLFVTATAPAAVRYVDVNSASPAPPYTNWSTAAVTIQDAVDAAVAGDQILVTNGVYKVGGRAVFFPGASGTNRVAVTKPLSITSVNGPEFTLIQGYQMPGTTNGPDAIRCAYLTNGASLSGFTLTNGATANGQIGGGVWCQSTNSLVTNCVLVGNSAHSSGGGAFRGTLNNCTLTGNTASQNSGGGAYQSTLNNCTLNGNSAYVYGGGAAQCTLNNCTLIGNSSQSLGGGADTSTLNNCVLSGNLAVNGGGGVAFSTMKNCVLTGNSAGGFGGGASGVGANRADNCTLTGNSAGGSGGGADGVTLYNCIVYFNTSGQGPAYGSNTYNGSLNYCCTTPLPFNGIGNITADPQLASASHLSATSPCRAAGNAAYATGTDIDGELWLNPPSIGCDQYHAGAVTGPLSVGIKTTTTTVVPGYLIGLTALIDGRTSASVWEFGDGLVSSNQPYASHAWIATGDYPVVLRAYNDSFPEGISATVTVHVVEQPVHHVAADNSNPVAPYLSWTTAATNIQDAVDAASLPGSLVLVTNGTYAAGGSLGNRVAVRKLLALRSVNGPQVTVISGGGATRCVYLTNGASLTGFTLTNGVTSGSGGGVLCQSACAVVSNCVVVGNSASSGGGASGGTLNNCALTGNSAAAYGGGASGGTLNNSTLTGNSAGGDGGGAYFSTLNNCLIYFNQALAGTNYSGGTLNYCCTSPQPTSSSGNISADPQLASATYLSSSSPCRGAGSAAYAIGTDIDGEAWVNPPSIGCDEYYAGANTGALTVSISAPFTLLPSGYLVRFTALIEGRTSTSVWDFGDGVVVSNRPYASHAWAAPGDYAVVLRAYNESQPAGISATVTVQVVTQLVHYVAPDSVNPSPPYATWATAAASIQDAVDVAFPGDQILVTNGVYQTGSRIVSTTGGTNRVAVIKALAIQSVNGPQFTAINGGKVVGCVYLTIGASLSGFTLTNGVAASGGGIYSVSSSAVVSNCVIVGNSSSGSGGGAYSGTLKNCTLTGNSATNFGGGAYSAALNNCTLTGNLAYESGGGASDCTLNNCAVAGNSAATYGGGAYSGSLKNCTLTSNSAAEGGGAFTSTLNNCILYFNSAPYSPNYSGNILNYCCTTPLPTNGIGNISADPQLASRSHLSAASPCRGAGSSAYATGTDIDGEAWANPLSIGCDEYHTGAVTGALSVGISAPSTLLPPGFTVGFTALIDGRTSASVWEFGDGVVVSNQPYASHAWSATGDYPVILRAYNESHPGGISATVMVQVVTQPVRYVAADSINPLPPYGTWATAAATIQDAVDVAFPGDEVVVTNGIYATGGLTHVRVAVRKPLSLRSVNGPQFTVIKGYIDPSRYSDGWIRCVTLASGASLSGFTLTNGGTFRDQDSYPQDLPRNAGINSGGGVFCSSATAVVSNCVLTGNAAYYQGGGAYRGTLINCTLSNNSAGESGGGASGGDYSSRAGNGCTLINCTLARNSSDFVGGGASYCMLNNCTLTGNSAVYSSAGGGAYTCTLKSCTLTGNFGGARDCNLNNCTVTREFAEGVRGCTLNNCTLTATAGAYGSTLNNCIVYDNPVVSSDLNYCWVADPMFVDLAGGNYRLQSSSPCINSGFNASSPAGPDFDGNPRIAGGTVDIGAYEFQSPASMISYAWLQQYGLVPEAAVDSTDSDGDGTNNWQEWIAGTIPTNALSVLRLMNPTHDGSGLVVTWESVSDRTYFLERSINLGANPAFLTLATDLSGQPGTTSYTDTYANGSGPYFYRVGVQTGSTQFHFPASIIPFPWLQQFGLPTDGSADYLDTDSDFMNNWQEWIAGTAPTDPSSALRMLNSTNAASGLTVSWQSVSNRMYFVERATNLGIAQPFSVLDVIVGQAGTTSYTDPSAIGPGPFFYRVGVQP